MGREAIFIGYRREDTADVAGRLYDALTQRFGRGRIFKDVDNLRPGENFGNRLRAMLARCHVALILIGPSWVDTRDGANRKRIDDPGDWVRVEIETALETPGMNVIPVLVNGARMPLPTELPPSLHLLLSRHAATIRPDPDFRSDVARLATTLGFSPRRHFRPVLFVAGVAVTVVALAYVAWINIASPCSAVQRVAPPPDSEQRFEFEVRLARDNFAVNNGERCRAVFAAQLEGLETQSWNHILGQEAAGENATALIAAYQWHLTLFPQGSDPPPRHADQAAARISAFREQSDGATLSDPLQQ